MNAARQIIADAARQGATFRLADGKLRLVPPPGQQPAADLVARAKAHRDDIIAALSKSAETNFRTTTRARERGSEFSVAVSREATTREALAGRIDVAGHLARARATADRRNRECERAGITDRFCRCGHHAGLAWPNGRGGEVWVCDECAPTRGFA